MYSTPLVKIRRLLKIIERMVKDKKKTKVKHFKDPKPAREVSLIYPKNELKIHIIDALRNVISGVIRGAIAFQDIQIISPIQKK